MWGNQATPPRCPVPVYLRKLFKEWSNAKLQVETGYLRPDVDILYLLDFFTLDVRALLSNGPNQTTIKNLVVNPTFVDSMMPRRMADVLVRYLDNVKKLLVYTFEGKRIGSEWRENRSLCWNIELLNVKTGKFDDGNSAW